MREKEPPRLGPTRSHTVRWRDAQAAALYRARTMTGWRTAIRGEARGR